MRHWISPVVGLTLLISTSAIADPIVAAGGKAGVAKSWSTEGKTVVLVIADSFDADDVAVAIKAGVKGSVAKSEGNRVIVSGIPQNKLIAALEKVAVDPAMDDVDEMLSSLKAGGEDEEGSGSSIRATQAADFSDVLGDTSERLEGHVVGVTRARFPLVIVSVKVDKVPVGYKGIKKGQRITVVPLVKSKGGVIDPLDRASQLNVGGWYSQDGDRVILRLGKKRKKTVWIAKGFERQPK